MPKAEKKKPEDMEPQERLEETERLAKRYRKRVAQLDQRMRAVEEKLGIAMPDKKPAAGEADEDE